MTRHAGMRDYYDRRAAEYDDWWHGTGLFADRHRPGWTEEVAALVGALRGLPTARTLDVACGTGFLTRELPGDVVGLDQSETMVGVASGRVAQVVHGDALALPFPGGSFDRVFTGHFYGHLDAEERAAFLTEARRVAGELVVCDSGGGDREEWQERTLDDGSRHHVYKRWFSGAGLAAELGGGRVVHDGQWFVLVACW